MKLRSLMLSMSLALAVCQAQDGKFAPDLNFQEIRQTTARVNVRKTSAPRLQPTRPALKSSSNTIPNQCGPQGHATPAPLDAIALALI